MRRLILIGFIVLMAFVLTGCDPVLDVYFTQEELTVQVNSDDVYNVGVELVTSGFGMLYVEKATVWTEVENAQELREFFESVVTFEDAEEFYDDDGNPNTLRYSYYIEQELPAGFLFELVAGEVFDFNLEDTFFNIEFSPGGWDEGIRDKALEVGELTINIEIVSKEVDGFQALSVRSDNLKLMFEE